MAQHYSIGHNNDEFYDIFLFIQQNFSNDIENLPNNFQKLEQKYAFINPNFCVYKYIKWQDSQQNIFEIHYDPITKKIFDVFLVC